MEKRKHLPLYSAALVFQLLLLLGCNSSPSQNAQSVESSKSAKTPADFLALFRNIETDSFFIESTYGSEDLSKFKFKGVELDSIFYSFFGDADLIKWVKRGGGQLFACYRFPLSATVEGLILRTPSDYWESSIRIYLFDNQTGKTFRDLEVGESWGDAGDSLIKFALLIKQKAGWKVLIFQNLCHPMEEDNLDSIECWDSTFQYTILPNAFREISKAKSDTTRVNALIKRFSGK